MPVAPAAKGYVLVLHHTGDLVFMVRCITRQKVSVPGRIWLPGARAGPPFRVDAERAKDGDPPITAACIEDGLIVEADRPCERPGGSRWCGQQ